MLNVVHLVHVIHANIGFLSWCPMDSHSLPEGVSALSNNHPECTTRPIDEAWATYPMVLNTITLEFLISITVSLVILARFTTVSIPKMVDAILL
jgi:hypothetical protein